MRPALRAPREPRASGAAAALFLTGTAAELGRFCWHGNCKGGRCFSRAPWLWRASGARAAASCSGGSRRPYGRARRGCRGPGRGNCRPPACARGKQEWGSRRSSTC
jgi:hypothetical protein